MIKTIEIKLEEFTVTAKKLVVDEVLDIAEEIAKRGYLDGFAVLAEQAKNEGWLKTIQENREIVKTIAETALTFPEEKSIGSIYPEELIVLFPKIMEVNNGFLELMELTSVISPVKEKIPTQKKPSKS